MAALYQDANGAVRRIVETVEVTEERLVKEIDQALSYVEELKQELTNYRDLTGTNTDQPPAQAPAQPAAPAQDQASTPAPADNSQPSTQPPATAPADANGV